MAGARPIGTNRAELYETLLAAYKEMRDGYDTARPNIIVAITDGGDSDTSDVRRERFKQDLQRLADPTKPIRIVLIGVNVSQPDAANLQGIAEIVGGGFFPSPAPSRSRRSSSRPCSESAPPNLPPVPFPVDHDLRVMIDAVWGPWFHGHRDLERRASCGGGRRRLRYQRFLARQFRQIST